MDASEMKSFREELDYLIYENDLETLTEWLVMYERSEEQYLLIHDAIDRVAANLN
jgi:hypothetical protein